VHCSKTKRFTITVGVKGGSFLSGSRPGTRGGQPLARHAPNFPNVSRDAPCRRIFLVAMLLHIISYLPGNIIKLKVW